MYLEVDPNHQLYIEQHGNLQKPSFLFLHGGPGLACTENDLKFFDLDHCNVVLMDQRGCGRSKSKAPLLANTAMDLMMDCKAVLDYFEIEKAHVFGGSWGSCLAVLFALNFPERTDALILRGLFLGSKMERRGFEKGSLANKYPEAWSLFHSLFPRLKKEEVFDAYVQRLLQGGDKKPYVKAFLAYGRNLSYLPFDEEEWWKNGDKELLCKKAEIMAHYTHHNFFLPDNFLWENLNILQGKKIMLIHGAKDRITYQNFAELMTLQISSCELILTEGGHFAFDPANQKALIQAVKKVLA